MKYVVTGGAGFIGSHLTKILVEQGHKVTVIDNLHTGKKENVESIKEKIIFVKGDILDDKLLNLNFNKYSIYSYKNLDILSNAKKLDYSIEISWI